MHGVLVLKEHLHADEGLPPFLGEHVPGLGARQQVGDGALRQPQDTLPEQTLADRVLRKLFLHLQGDGQLVVASILAPWGVAAPQTACLITKRKETRQSGFPALTTDEIQRNYDNLLITPVVLWSRRDHQWPRYLN